MAQKQQLLQQLRDVGSKLESPPPSKDALIKLLKQIANYLSELDQSPSPVILEAMKPSQDALAKAQLLKSLDKDVKVLVATCICEITRITAPEPPYSDEVLRDIFQLFVWTFSGLGDVNSPSFGRRVVILETLARYRLFLMMLDLDCNDLINEMFRTFFAVVSDNHPENVLGSMRIIMTLILNESEDVEETLIFTILSSLGHKEGGPSPAAHNLAVKVIEHCSRKLETPIKQFLLSSISGDPSASNKLIDYHEVIYNMYQCAPQILFGVIPYITGELLTDKVDVRLKAVNLLGSLFALPGISISESFKPLFSEFLKRLTDRVVEVRLSVVEHAKNCLISDPSRAEAADIISALRDRLLDYDEHVRKQVVTAIYDVACHKLSSIPSASVRIAAERLRDKSVSVRQYTIERLAEVYRLYCQDNSGVLVSDNFEWIPGKILRCLYDKDFRSDMIEGVLCKSLFPPEFSVKDKVQHWIAAFSWFDKVEVKAFEQMLMQKQRLQHELQKYLSLRQTHQDGDGPEHQKKLSGCFRTMARFFNDPVKTEESFQLLNQLKDANIWRNLSQLLDPAATYNQSWTYRDELLRILGEKHPLYDFTFALSLKSSFLLVNKEIIKEILGVVASSISDGNIRLETCMKLLAVLACYFPMHFSGFEEDLISLLKEDNDMVKEGIAHVLAKAGGIIREKLTTASSSVELLLERLCLEGSRKQAKYAVQALAAITKDDGLKSLSVLYKRLVDLLEERTHLPSILQSLGSIAQHAMPIFETREREILDFVSKKILQGSNKEDYSEEKFEWTHQSELCKLKIFGLKALAKSFMPVKDAHLRTGMEKLLEIIKNILLFGEVTTDIVSSPVDKAHMRLAAAKALLRLSKQWDHKIPVDVIYLAFNISQDTFLEARKLFKCKIHQYIKERSLDAKYACAFVYNIVESHPPGIAEDKHNLIEIVQMHHQLKVRHLSVQSDLKPLVAYPEYILPWLVHALAHHPSFPDIDGEEVKSFEPIYWRLHMFLSALLLGDENLQSDMNSCRIKESFTAVASILHSIKLAEDSIDKLKVKNSQALCDLGLSIAKYLVNDHGDVNEVKTTVPLPGEIYKQHKTEGEPLASREPSWLGGATALAYFKSLLLKNDTSLDAIKSEHSISDIDIDANDLPLGKIMKSLKLQAAKRKKKVKAQACNSVNKKLQNEVDVLGVVREINLGSQEDKNMADRRLAKEDKLSATGLLLSPSDKSEHLPLNMNIMPLSVPKRKRSSFGSSPMSAKDRKSSRSSQFQEFQISDKEEKVASDSDLLVTCMSVAKSIVSGGKRIGTHQNTNGKASVLENDYNLGRLSLPENLKRKTRPLSAGQNNRKRKRKSIALLEKCSQKIVEDNSKLVGCMINVWWPLDKRYYKGKVQSYDEVKKKHVILYDDGDVEVLRLDKERWKLVDSDEMATKIRAQDHSSEEDMSSDGSGEASRRSFKNKSGSEKKSGMTDEKRIASMEKLGKIKKTGRMSDKGLREKPTIVSTNKPGNSLQNNENRLDYEDEPVKYPEGEEIIEHADIELVKTSSEEADEDSSNCNGKHLNSDDEPLTLWRQRIGK